LSVKTSLNTVVVFPKENFKIGDYVHVKVNSCTGGTLIGVAVK
jgi:tRNA-2-methylthio-N6-dimethylallyladenosine synthase